MRSTLYPLIGDRIYGPIDHTVDVFAILGTMFGIATTLGLSVSQINAGMNYLWPAIPVNITVQIITIAAIGMWRALVIEGHQETSLQGHMQHARHGDKKGPGFWKKRLASLIDFPNRNDVERFIRQKGLFRKAYDVYGYDQQDIINDILDQF